MLESWRWLHSLHSTLLSREVDWTQLDHVIDAVVAKIPELAGIKDAAPDATFRIRGQKLAREPHRYSGRTAMRANISVHEPRQPQDIDTMFTFSMEGNKPADRAPFASAVCLGTGLELPAGVEQIPGRSGRQTALWRSGRASV
ncbi:NADH-quinone oxidoreductase subunit G [Escherichia coli]|uniref:NADH-quinone oxidoreductase subunit G n=1 Tax=Escherichia coli TaxID=562 RepID=A0A376L835_ECOLX|nr:NADH-quinone oxidoreductase subunit G [Escherichia coli]